MTGPADRASEEAPPEAKALKDAADTIKGSRFTLVKNRESLTEAQHAKLASLKKAGSRLFRTWELKKDMRAAFRARSTEEVTHLLESWIHGTAYCKIKPVIADKKKARRYKADIIAEGEGKAA